MSRFIFVVALVVAPFFVTEPCAAQTFTRRIANRGLAAPVFAVQKPGDTQHMLVVEKDTGRIEVLDLATGTVAAEPFAQIAGVATGGERGLLGMSFHPDYLENGRFYVYASQSAGGHHSEVFEYTVSGDPATSLQTDNASRRSLLSFSQPAGNHNGGWIGFQPQASVDERTYLYIASGDGGGANDERNNAQDITDNLLGKMLRIDVSGDDFPQDEARNYAIPASNPFVNSDGDDEIWAYGLRNPWRNSFDRQTGDLWIGDVGQNELEEIDFVPAGSEGGQNFGWRVMEGNECFRTGSARDGNPACDDPQFVPPVYEYTHGSGAFQGNSVTGGYVYRGPVKEFQGHYFFADFGSRHIWTMDPFSGEVVNRNTALAADSGNVRADIGSFAEDNAGNLYVVSLGGSIFRIESNSQDAVWNGGTGEFSDATMWTRNGQANTAFVDGDHLLVSGGPLTVPENTRASALQLDAGSELIGNGMEIVSGNVFVADSSLVNANPATLSNVQGPGSIRKLGPGSLSVTGELEDLLVIQDGAVSLVNAQETSVLVQSNGLLRYDQSNDVTIPNLEIETGGTLNVLLRLESNKSLLIDDSQLAGTLQIDLTWDDGPAPSGELIRFSDIASGRFDEIVLHRTSLRDGPYHHGRGSFTSLVESDNGISLEDYIAIPGDADGDGVVGFADFLQLSSNFAMPGGWTDGDFTLDGVVQNEDFLILSASFGNSVATAFAVPEPAAVFSLASLVTLLGLCTRKPRSDR